jgi:hypothetical protein
MNPQQGLKIEKFDVDHARDQDYDLIPLEKYLFLFFFITYLARAANRKIPQWTMLETMTLTSYPWKK